MPLKRRSQDVHCPMKAVPSLPRFMSTNINLDIWVPLHHYPTNFQILPGQWCQIADISLISGVHSGSVLPSILRSTKFMALRSISFALSWLKEGSHDYNLKAHHASSLVLLILYQITCPLSDCIHQARKISPNIQRKDTSIHYPEIPRAINS
jgi:hypothetical protein